MQTRHDLGRKILNIKISWMRKLNQRDQQYLESRLTMKHLSLFKLYCQMKGRTYQNSKDLEKDLAIYLLLIMFMNSASETEPLLKEFSQFSHVPNYLMKFAEDTDPFKMEIDTFEMSRKIAVRFNLFDFYNKALGTQENYLKKIFIGVDFDMFGDIVDYYSLEIVAFTVIRRINLKDFDYQTEIAHVFQFLIKKYYENFEGKDENEKRFSQLMKEYVAKQKVDLSFSLAA